MDHAKMNVLIAEDNPGDVGLVADAFKQSGNGDFELMNAPSLESAMKFVSKKKVDAILLDLSLPLFLGLEPLARIHRLRPRIPIFVLSGYNDPELVSSAKQMGAQDYIVKNHLDGDALVKKVRAAIDHRKKFSSRRES